MYGKKSKKKSRNKHLDISDLSFDKILYNFFIFKIIIFIIISIQ